MPTRIPKITDPDALISGWRAKGIGIESRGVKIGEEPAAEKPVKVKPKLITPAFEFYRGMPTWFVPIVIISEANERGHWSKAVGRKGHQRREIQKALASRMRYLVPLAEHVHAGGAIGVRLTRIGPRTLDKGNCWRAVKAAEDAVADFLGIDDGSPQWRIEVEQEKKSESGLKIQMWCVKE